MLFEEQVSFEVYPEKKYWNFKFLVDCFKETLHVSKGMGNLRKSIPRTFYLFFKMSKGLPFWIPQNLFGLTVM